MRNYCIKLAVISLNLNKEEFISCGLKEDL